VNKIPILGGIIRRRVLINYRVDPVWMKQQLPSPFQPLVHRGYAIAGICLIRLERMSPLSSPLPFGFSSENAAHRVAVHWQEESVAKDGVFVMRRDTNSLVNFLLGGKFFSGPYHRADFQITDASPSIQIGMRSRDSKVRLAFHAIATGEFPSTSVFRSLAEASEFFERGSLGYSAAPGSPHYDGIELNMKAWDVHPLSVSHLSDNYFDDRERFPEGSITFDHALILRDVRHQWVSAPSLYRVGRSMENRSTVVS
jgi:hypothetical protein